LTRVSVVDTGLNLIYESIVVPDNEILDYNTRWSGLTKDSFTNCNVKLKNVQEDLLKLFSKDTILIGHSLESDLKALKVGILVLKWKFFDKSVFF
jgi:RNA exonuclease 1